MTPLDKVPQNIKVATYQTMKAIQLGEIPLVIADEPAQWEYLQVLPSALNGTVLYASASDASEQVTEHVGNAGYLFLVLDAEMGPDLTQLIQHYLTIRDASGQADARFELRSGRNLISPDHRLVLVCNLAIYRSLGRWIMKYITAIAVRT